MLCHIKTHTRHHNVQKLYVNQAGLLLGSLGVDVVVHDLVHYSIPIIQHLCREILSELTQIGTNYISILLGGKAGISGVRELHLL